MLTKIFDLDLPLVKYNEDMMFSIFRNSKENIAKEAYFGMEL